MSKLILLFAVGVTTAVATELESDWLTFKDSYGKAYESEQVELERKSIWAGNRKYIDAHNRLYAKGLSSFYLGENKYADMTNEEFLAQMNGFKMNAENHPDTHVEGNTTLPDTVDWRTKGYVTPVKDQASCESCWAFSATGSMEGQHFKATNKLVSLSESNLVDCSSEYGNGGCHGGTMHDAFKYVIANRGIDDEKTYPYHDWDEPCRFNYSDVAATFSGFKSIASGSEAALQEAVATVGPISVGIDDGHPSFRFYKGGVYDEPKCHSRRDRLHHAVLVIGYGTYKSKPYWLVKNSWGTSWGIKGIVMMIRNKNNQCGIASAAIYPVV